MRNCAATIRGNESVENRVEVDDDDVYYYDDRDLCCYATFLLPPECSLSHAWRITHQATRIIDPFPNQLLRLLRTLGQQVKF